MTRPVAAQQTASRARISAVRISSTGVFDDAEPKLLLATQEDPSNPQAYRYLAACYAHMGRLDDAREVVTRLRAVTPIAIPDASYLRNPEHRELFLSGLRLATGEATLPPLAVSP